jgi:exodeoxyribonuclease-3
MNAVLSTSLTVATVNVNGLRAAARKDMAAWVAESGADVVTLQEVRAPDDLVAGLVADVFGDDWHLCHAEAAAKGRAGVAVVSRLPIVRTADGSDEPCFAATGRWIEADVDADGSPVTVISAYAHTGDADDADRMAEKLAWFDAATERLETLRAEGRHVLFTGDLNVAHRDADLKNWKGNVGRAGCHPDERARFDIWTDQLGWVDVARSLAGGDDDVAYTWWSYRGRAFDTDAGWRIDYQFATPELAAAAVSARVDRADSYDRRWSDHAPVVVTYELSGS